MLKNFVLESLEAIEHWHNQQLEKFAELEREEHAKETLQILKENSLFKTRKAREFIVKVMNTKGETEIIKLVKQFEEETRA